MNEASKQFIRENQALSNGEIAAAWNNSPSHYRAVRPPSVAQWLAEDGLRERLELWLEATVIAPSDLAATMATPQGQMLLAIRAGIKQLLVMQASGDKDAQLDIAPGTGNRQLLDAAIATADIPVLQDDLDRLLMRARPGFEPLTEADVAAYRLVLPHEQHAETLARKLDIGRHTNRLRLDQYLADADADPSIEPLPVSELVLLGELPE